MHRVAPNLSVMIRDSKSTEDNFKRHGFKSTEEDFIKLSKRKIVDNRPEAVALKKMQILTDAPKSSISQLMFKATMPVWAWAKKKVNEAAVEHFKKHGKDFNAKDVHEYMKFALDFIETGATQSKVGKDGDNYYFSHITDFFAVETKDKNAIRTFYKIDKSKHNYQTSQEYFDSK